MSGNGTDVELAMLRAEFLGHLIGEESIMAGFATSPAVSETGRTRTPSSHRILVSCGRR